MWDLIIKAFLASSMLLLGEISSSKLDEIWSSKLGELSSSKLDEIPSSKLGEISSNTS